MNTAVDLYAWISIDTARAPLVLGMDGDAWRGTPRPTTPAANLACDAAQALLAAVPPVGRENMGLFIGSTTGSLADDIVFDASRRTDGGQYPSPNAFRRTLPSTIPSELTIELGLRGPVVVYAAGAASAVVACARGIDYVRRGLVPMAIVGGIETGVSAGAGRNLGGAAGMQRTQYDSARTPMPPAHGRCQILLALIGASAEDFGLSPRYKFTRISLGPSELYAPGQEDRSHTALVNLLSRGQGRILAHSATGVQALLEIEPC